MQRLFAERRDDAGQAGGSFSPFSSWICASVAGSARTYASGGARASSTPGDPASRSPRSAQRRSPRAGDAQQSRRCWKSAKPRVLLAQQLGARSDHLRRGRRSGGAGLLIGRRLRQRHEVLREPFGVLQAALLGVVGLILAFGLSLAVGRYEDRAASVVSEANAIGTTYLRAQLLAEPFAEPLAGAAAALHRPRAAPLPRGAGELAR